MANATVVHHLDDATLMAYAAGTLSEAFNLIVATHLSLCDTCRASVQAYDAVGGALLDGEAAPVAADLLHNVLAHLDDEFDAPVHRMGYSDIPAPLHSYIGEDLSAVRWQPIGMGVKQAILPTSKGATARLLCIPAGSAMPDHGHRGTEMTLVIKGAFKDADDYFARGDIEIADSNVQHIPIADVHEDCICLAVTDAPLRFTSFLPRLLQRFYRI